MQNIFDTHAHYDDARFDEDRREVLSSMPSKGVCGIINIGCTLERSEKSVKLAKEFPHVYATVGIHPEDVYDLPSDWLDRLKALAKQEKVVAIGEIGLDYHYEGFDKVLQQRIFEEQLALAKEIDLPVVIHSRDATADTMEILHRHTPKGVMHCFSGSAETAKEVLDLGMYISFTGVLTFSNARRAIEACAAVPLDKLLLETDCPYMAPTPFRGKRCDSSMIEHIANKIGEINGITGQQVADNCLANTAKLFGITL